MASEKELNIKVTTQTEVSSIQDLSIILEEIKTKADELQSSLDSIELDSSNVDGSDISDTLDDASNSASDLSNALNDIDGSELDNVSSMSADASESMSDASSNADDLSSAINNVDSSTVQNLTQEIDELKNKLNETEESTSAFDEIMGLASNAAIVAGYKSMADEAGSYGDSMVRLGHAMSGHSMSVEQVEQTYGSLMKGMREKTGRGAGAVRSHITNLANVGIKNTKILEDSFNAVSKSSFQMQIPFEQADKMFQRMALTGRVGANQLKNFGLEQEDLAKVMGVSADEVTKKFKTLDKDTRASILSSAINMKMGESINDDYKNSYEHLLETVDRAKDYFSRLVGKVFLPYLIPAVEKAVDVINFLAEGFDKLPSPLKGAIGGIATVSAGFSLLAIAGAGAMRIGSSLISPYMKLGKVLSGQGTIFEKLKKSLGGIGGSGDDCVETPKPCPQKKGKSILKDEGGSVGKGGAKTTTFDGIKQSFKNAMDSIKSGVVSTKAKIVEFANSIKLKLSTAFNTVRAKAISFSTTLKTSLVNGFNSAKQGIINLATSIKTTLVSAFQGAITKAKTLALGLLDLGKKALISGYNALKSAGMWLVEKASLIASAVAKGVATVSSWALAVAEWAVASPILIIVAVVLILIGVLIYLYNTNETVRNAINSLGETFVLIGQTIYNAFMNAVNMVIGFLTGLWNYITSIGQMILQSVGITGDNIMASVLGFIVFMATLPLQIGIIFTNIIAKALGFGDNFAQRMLSAGMNSVKNFIGQIATAYNKLKTELQNMLSAVGEWASTLPQKFWDAGVNAVKSFLSALGIASPGIMQRTLVWEISEMGRRVPEESQNLLTNVGKLGTNIVDEFGEPSLGINYEDTGNAKLNNNNLNGSNGNITNPTINITIGSVDNDERVNQIVEAVRKALAFENETAGRNV